MGGAGPFGEGGAALFGEGGAGPFGEGGRFRTCFAGVSALICMFLEGKSHSAGGKEMKFLLYLLAGAAGGLLGGMGMGGGTVLIPILTVLCGVSQHLAQSVNLFAFLPMAVFSLRVHAKNGLLDARGTPWMIVPAAALSALGAWLVQGVAAEALRVGFGVFLCILSLYQFAGGVKALRQKRR